METRVECLQVDQVFELEVTWCSSALTELLHDLPKAVADPLPRYNVVVLDLQPHVFWEERLIA